MKRSSRPWMAVGLLLGPLAAAPPCFGQAEGEGVRTAPIEFPRGYQASTTYIPADAVQALPPTPFPAAPPADADGEGVVTPYGTISGRSVVGRASPAIAPTALVPIGSPQTAGYGATPAAPAKGGAGVNTPYGTIPGQSASGQLGGAGAAAGAGAGGAGAGYGEGVGYGEGADYGAGAGYGAGPGYGAGAGGEGAGAGAPGGMEAAAAAAGDLASNAGLSGYGGPGGATSAEANFPPNMIGDLAPTARFVPMQGPPTVGPPGLPGVRGASLFAPSIRTLKISENQSPRPQDRIYYNFNFFDDVAQAQNQYDRSPIRNMRIYRHLLGFEKTFDQGRGSFGMRMPIDTLTADSIVQGFQTPTHTGTGNLNLFAKYILKQNVRTGSLASVGLAISPPTAQSRFAGAPYVFGMNNTSFQPFLGYILNFDRFYIQGFSSFLFTSSQRDVTLIYNDVGIGYYLYRSQDPDAFLSAFVPNFEVHVNDPLTHRDWKNRFDPAAMADIVDLTYGLNFRFGRSAMLTTALVTPVTGPRPFSGELAVFLNIFYGRSRLGRVPTPPPVL